MSYNYAHKIATDAVIAETDRLLDSCTAEQQAFFDRVCPKYPEMDMDDLFTACNLVHRTTVKNTEDAANAKPPSP